MKIEVGDLRSRHILCFGLVVVFCAMFSSAQLSFGKKEDPLGLPPKQEEVITSKVLLSHDRVGLGQKFWLAVVLEIKDKFHINPDASKLEKDSYLFPTSLKVTTVPEWLGVEMTRYPQPVKENVSYSPKPLDVLKQEVVLIVPMHVSDTAKGGTWPISLELAYQACDDRQCLMPTRKKLEAKLIVAENGSDLRRDSKYFKGLDQQQGEVGRNGSRITFDFLGRTFDIQTDGALGWSLFIIVAMFGGLLLNFTPCVLPVIPLKVISLSQMATNRMHCILLGTMTSLGVVLFWLIMGTVIAFFSGFSAIHQLFQYPAFTILVGVIIAIMSVGMCGLFSIQLPGWVYRISPEHSSSMGSVAFGVMTAVLSTPCTAPFMGAAAAWAALQEPWVTISTFMAIGLGMALPYWVLSLFPSALSKVPKTGPLSLVVKEVMGLLMLAAASYFIGVGLNAVVTKAPDPPSKAHWYFVMGFVTLAGLWLMIKSVKIEMSKFSRGLGLILALAMVVTSVYGSKTLTDNGPIPWRYYTEARLNEAFQDKKIVLLDFTAQWCINCKALEKHVLNDPAVVELLQDPSIIPFKVDLTSKNVEGKAKLKEAQRVAIPLLIIYSADGREVFKSDFYGVEQVLKALKRAGYRG